MRVLWNGPGRGHSGETALGGGISGTVLNTRVTSGKLCDFSGPLLSHMKNEGMEYDGPRVPPSFNSKGL